MYVIFFFEIFHRNFRMDQNISFGGQTKMSSETDFGTLVQGQDLVSRSLNPTSKEDCHFRIQNKGLL